MRAGARKQATIPLGATVLDPIGTAPGLVVAPAGPPLAGTREPAAGQPTIVVLPGPPGELQPMWEAAVRDGALRGALAGGSERRSRTLRLFGIPESEIAETLRRADRAGIDLGRLEITTCLKRGEVEVVTRYEPGAQETYEQLAKLVRARHADTLFSEDGSTIDEQVAALLGGGEHGAGASPAPPAAWRPLTIAVAESCTGGLLVARLTDRPGASEYVRGAIVAYANEVKSAQVGVPAELIERHGAVSPEVAQALAEGARTRLETDVGVGITGIAGPGGGTPEKPVGLVCLSVAGPDEVSLTRSVTLPGARADVRERATTVALHLVRRALLGRATE
jgi:nicotinamide-nucleotide amidase